VRRALFVAILCASLPLRLSAQAGDCGYQPARVCAEKELRVFAATAATAWAGHDFAGVVGEGRVEVRIAGVSAAGPLPSDQATAVLVNHVRGAEEVEVAVVTVMAVSDVSGYAELRRRFRPAGVGGAQEETILLGFTRSKGVGGSLGPWAVGVVEVVGREGR
jgi:hypothetical protein